MEIQKDRGSIAREFLALEIQRQFTNIAKRYLENLEGIKYQHDIMIKKLKENFPEKSKEIDLINFFDEAKVARVRKQILDASGDAKRDLLSILDKFEAVAFNGNKF